MEKESFKARFRELFDLSGCPSVTQFAKQLDMNRQSVDRYYNGERCPDAPALAQICEKMKVSADWLLGLSETRAASADVQNAVNVLGLSEEAINAIIDTGGIGQCKDALSHLLVSERFLPLLMQYDDYLTIADIENQNLDEEENVQFNLENHTVTLPIRLTLDYQRQIIMETISAICKDEIIPYASYDQTSGWTYPRQEAIEKRHNENRHEST